MYIFFGGVYNYVSYCTKSSCIFVLLNQFQVFKKNGKKIFKSLNEYEFSYLAFRNAIS